MVCSPENSNFVSEVGKLPVVNKAYNILASYYSRVKDYNGFTKLTFDIFEKMAGTAVAVAKPVCKILERPINYMDKKSREYFEVVVKTYPIFKGTPDDVKNAFSDVYKTKVETLSDEIASSKKKGFEKVKSMLKYTQDKVAGLTTTLKIDETLKGIKLNAMIATEAILDYFVKIDDLPEELKQGNMGRILYKARKGMADLYSFSATKIQSFFSSANRHREMNGTPSEIIPAISKDSLISSQPDLTK